MNRGIVMEIGKRHIVVLTADGQFRKVPARRSAVAVGEEISFTAQERLRKPQAFYSIGVAAAMIVLLLTVPFLVKQSWMQPQVAAYLTMDINPSVELGIDDDDRVVELRALNRDGAAVTADVQYKGLPVEQVAENIMDHVVTGQYLSSGEGDVVITSVLIKADSPPAYESELTKRADGGVRKALAKKGKAAGGKIGITTLSAPKEVRDEANEKGLSTGKMAVYLLARSRGLQISIDHLKTHSIHQTVKELGGINAIVDDSQDKDKSEDKDKPEKENRNEKQKAQLMEQLKEEKKIASLDEADDNDKKADAKKEGNNRNNGKKNGKSDDKKAKKDGDGDRKPISIGEFEILPGDPRAFREHDRERDAIRENKSDAGIKAEYGTFRASSATQKRDRSDSAGKRKEEDDGDKKRDSRGKRNDKSGDDNRKPGGSNEQNAVLRPNGSGEPGTTENGNPTSRGNEGRSDSGPAEQSNGKGNLTKDDQASSGSRKSGSNSDDGGKGSGGKSNKTDNGSKDSNGKSNKPAEDGKQHSTSGRETGKNGSNGRDINVSSENNHEHSENRDHAKDRSNDQKNGKKNDDDSSRKSQTPHQSHKD